MQPAFRPQERRCSVWVADKGPVHVCSGGRSRLCPALQESQCTTLRKGSEQSCQRET